MDMADVYRLLDFWRLNPPPTDMLQILAMQKGWKRPEPEIAPISFEAMEKRDGNMFKGLRRWFPAGPAK
jgi:hypothetical protein